MTAIKGNAKSVKEHAGLIYFHIYGWKGEGWVAVSKDLFDRVYKESIVKKVYYRHNRDIERKIKRLERHIRILKKEKGQEHYIQQKENEIRALKAQIKKEMDVHDLAGRKVIFKIS